MRVTTQHSYRVPISSLQARARPKTAQNYSFKKLTQILEGKYMSIQNKMSNKKLSKNGQEKKNRQSIIGNQTRLQSARRVQRNPSIDNYRVSKEMTNIIELVNFEDLKRKSQIKSVTNKEIRVSKENSSFVPYAQQQPYFSVSQPNISMKKITKIKKHMINQNREKCDLDKTRQQTETIESWKNVQEEDLHFSSLFKKSWRF